MAEVTRRAVLTGLSACAVAPSLAQTAWPNRLITMVVGFPAGGPTDVVARIVARGLSQRLGQQVMVDNRPGATGTTAAAQVARAQADGYTLLAIPATYAASAALFRKLPYHSVDDFTAISTTVEFPYVVVTHAEHPVRTVADLVAAAKSASRSGPLTYGTSGVGSLQHLAMEHFARVANIKLQHVPFRGGAPAITELLGKRIDFIAEPPAALVELVRNGQLRAVAVTGGKRFFSLPEAPTVAESGFPGFVITGWQGLLAPANIPDPVLRRLHAVLADVLKEPATIEEPRKLGNDPVPMSPGEFKSRLAAEVETWTKVIAEANIERI